MGVMSGCKAEPTLDWTPSFFTTQEGSIMEQMVDRIIPTTDTPGAIDVGVHTFIDRMMADFYEEEKKLAFQAAIQKVDEDAKADFGKKFTALSDEQKDELLKKYDQAAYTKTTGEDHFFKTMKELTILGYFTSEQVGEQVMSYDPIPDTYDGCISWEEGKPDWSL